MNNLMFAFTLTMFAGISTGLGSLIVIALKGKNYSILSMFMGISAGVMISVSFMEILPESIANLQHNFGTKIGLQFALFSFFGGMSISALIDKCIPTEKAVTNKKESYKLYRTGIISAIIITLHNFPEGIATFMTAISNQKLAIPIAFAIATHNIPEGMSIATPIFYATGNRKRAFFYSFLTGLSEPFGALVAYLVLAKFVDEVLFGVVFGVTAGIMVFISFDELLPLSYEYGEHYTAIYGLILGMAIMSTSLVMFA